MADNKWYVVQHERIVVRSEPNRSGKVLEVLRKGSVLRISQHLEMQPPDHAPWARVDDAELLHFPLNKGAETTQERKGFVLRILDLCASKQHPSSSRHSLHPHQEFWSVDKKKLQRWRRSV